MLVLYFGLSVGLSTQIDRLLCLSVSKLKKLGRYLYRLIRQLYLHFYCNRLR